MDRRVGAFAMVLALFFGVFVGSTLIVRWTSFKLLDAKLAFIKELQLFEDEANHVLAQGWRAVAGELVDDYKRGRLDGMYAARTSEKPTNYELLAEEMATAVKFAYERRMMEAGDYPITHEKVRGEMEKDERIRLLWKTADILFEVAAARRVAADVDSDEELKRLDKATEPKKRELVALLGKIRQQ